jgi:membrane protein DedA with SNARE-associated domain
MPPEEQRDEPLVAKVDHKLSDGWALGLLGGYVIFRQITTRLGLAWAPKLADSHPWVIPLLNNNGIQLGQAGTGASGRTGMIVLVILASVFLSTVFATIFYWAGWRFGHRLAELGAQPGSPWAGVWNPKRIERAERWMDRYGVFVVFLGRLTARVALPVTLVAGASEMRFRRFIIANTLGAIGYATFWVLIGGAAQDRWPWLKDWIEDVYGPWAQRIGFGLLALTVVALALYFLTSKTTPSQGESDPSKDEPSRDRDVETSTEVSRTDDDAS